MEAFRSRPFPPSHTDHRFSAVERVISCFFQAAKVVPTGAPSLLLGMGSEWARHGHRYKRFGETTYFTATGNSQPHHSAAFCKKTYAEPLRIAITVREREYHGVEKVGASLARQGTRRLLALRLLRHGRGELTNCVEPHEAGWSRHQQTFSAD